MADEFPNVTDETEKKKAKLLMALRRAHERRAAEDRDAAQRALQEVTGSSTAQGLLAGVQQGLSHGLADDFERMGANRDEGLARRGSLADAILADTGERVAVDQMTAEATTPLAYNGGILLGALAAGAGTRGLFKGIGGARKAAATAKHRRAVSGIPDDLSSHPRAKQMARLRDEADAELARKTNAARRFGQLGFKTNRKQAYALDGLHGAIMGYGGLDPSTDEGSMDLDRAIRAVLGGAAGVAFAPAMAAGGNFGGQAAKYAQQQMGLNPQTSLRTARFRDGVSADDVLRQGMQADEFVARKAAAKAGVPEGDQGRFRRAAEPFTPLRDSSGTYTRGVSDHAMTNDAVASDMRADAMGRGSRAISEYVQRLLQAPQGGRQAKAMADEATTAAGDAVRQRLATRTPGPTQAGQSQREWVDALMNRFDARDTQITNDWKRIVSERLGKEGVQELRRRIAGRLMDAYERDGVDGLQAVIRDPKLQPFFDTQGLRTLTQNLTSARDQSSIYQAVQRLMPEIEEAMRRDRGGLMRKRPAPAYPNRRDQVIARYPLADDDARAVMRRTAPGSPDRMPIPKLTEPLDPRRAAPQLEATNARIRDYMREAGLTTAQKFRGREDFSDADVTAGGAGATAFAALVEKYGIGPAVEMMLGRRPIPAEEAPAE